MSILYKHCKAVKTTQQLGPGAEGSSPQLLGKLRLEDLKFKASLGAELMQGQWEQLWENLC